MLFSVLPHYFAAVLCAVLACLGLFRDPRSFPHRVYALGMIALGVEALFTGLSLQAIAPDKVLLWQHWRCLFAALLPGTWLLFSLSFPQGRRRPRLGRWAWIVVGAFLAPLIVVTLFRPHLFGYASVFPLTYAWSLSVGWAGYVFTVCFLLGVVTIMMLLERTLRAAKGRQRWQVKFLAVGIVALFSARIYTGTQVLLFHELDLDLEVINVAALLVANLLILVAILRARFLHIEIYFSETMLYRSFALLLVGLYLLAVAVLAKAIHYMGGGLRLPVLTLFLFLAFVALALGALSDRLRLRTKRYISRHFRRPQYDYRRTWMAFSERTASIVERHALCNAVVKMLSEIFDTLSVSLWLADETRQGLQYGASTVLSETQARGSFRTLNGKGEIIRLMGDQQDVVDLEDPESSKGEALKVSMKSVVDRFQVRYCVPLRAGDDFVGILTLGDRVEGVSFTLEELDLLKAVAQQVAASLLNLRLSEELHEAKEMKAFQTISALFAHDLKNLASKLSLLLQNLPEHFHNPEFRVDALGAISESVEKINELCSRLSLVRGKLELHPREADLNELVEGTLAALDGQFQGSLVKRLLLGHKVHVDPEQIRKVLRNLVQNAYEATEHRGKVVVSTDDMDGWAVITVSDNGGGISRDFLETALFRPFKTTKRQGTGIGLYQTKMIVEAHKGKIEVESREGTGTTFRVILPRHYLSALRIP